MPSANHPPDIAALRERIHSGTADADLLWDVGQSLGRWRSDKSGGARPEAEEPGVLALNDLQVIQLRDDLIAFTNSFPRHSEVPLAVWAIGKLVDHEHEPFFRAVLERGLTGDDAVLYQAIIALGNLERLPSEITSFAAHDVEANRAIARSYLEQPTRDAG
jgi:hypothetical protein